MITARIYEPNVNGRLGPRSYRLSSWVPGQGQRDASPGSLSRIFPLFSTTLAHRLKSVEGSHKKAHACKYRNCGALSKELTTPNTNGKITQFF